MNFATGPIHVLESLLAPERWLVHDWLLAMPALAALGLFLWIWCGLEYRRRLKSFVALRFMTGLSKQWVLAFRRIRALLVVAALMALCAALARPMGPAEAVAASRQGLNLMIALDGSRSMLAEDVPPNRFALAQAGVDSLLDSMNGDRAGLMLFAGQPTLVAPLTFDTVSLKLIERGLDPELAGKGGSALDKVIDRAGEYLSRKPSPSKVLVIFSDGEETEGDMVIAAQEAYQKHGVRVFTVGVGSAQGAQIPRLERNLKRQRVRMGTIHDADGKAVQSRLDERAMRTAALVGGGAYIDLAGAAGDLRSFYLQMLKPLAAPLEQVPLQDRKEWFQVPLELALALLLIEMLWPRRLAWRRRDIGTRYRATTLHIRLGLQFILVVAAAVAAHSVLAATPTAATSREPIRAIVDPSDLIARAQQLLNTGRAEEAFGFVQQALLDAPNDSLARYNYGVGAYARGKYAVAIESFEKLTASAEPEIEERSQLQLANSLYRLGAQMRPTNPQGTITQWEKALIAYGKASDAPITTRNRAAVEVDLLTLLTALARSKEREGDAAARAAAEQGIPMWREALGYLDRAVKLQKVDGDLAPIRRSRAEVADKIFRTYLTSADDKRRWAEYHKPAALELAIEQMQQAIVDYGEALAVRPGDRRAQTGNAAGSATLEPWLLELAESEHVEGVHERGAFLENAIELWRKAGALYLQALQQSPENAQALRGKQRNDDSLYDGYLELGDRELQRSQDAPSMENKDALLEQSFSHYQAALALKPASVVANGRLAKLGAQLAGRFFERGQRELAKGRELASPKPAEAMASLERSVQSFSKSLTFESASLRAQNGKQAAEDLLRSLRDIDAERQRKLLGQGKRLADTRDLQDPGKLALKLLDYESEKLAAKQQQDYSAPEDKSVKDW